MSTIKVDTIATRTGSGNITASNTIAGTSATLSGTLGVTGNTTVGGTLVNTGLITASAGLAVGGTGAANTLDDYEEGDWTPTLTGSSSNPTVGAYQYQVGKYTKIGRTVHAHIYLRINGGDMSGGSGDGRISGLPFAAGNADNITWGAGGFARNWMKSTGNFSTNRNQFKPVVSAGSAVFEMWQYNGTDAQYDTGWGITQIVAGDLIISGTFTYLTN